MLIIFIIRFFGDLIDLLEAISNREKIRIVIFSYQFTEVISMLSIISLSIASFINVIKTNISLIFLLKIYLFLCFVSFIFTIINIRTKYFDKFKKITNSYLQYVPIYNKILDGRIENILINHGINNYIKLY